MRHKGKTWKISSYYEKRWVTIRQTTKTAARNAYERGECFYMMPCLLSPDSRFDVESRFRKISNLFYRGKREHIINIISHKIFGGLKYFDYLCIVERTNKSND